MINNDTEKQRLIDSMLSSADGRIDKTKLTGALKSKNTDALINSLNKNDKEKLLNIMNDSSAMEKLLNSNEAKAIMKAFKQGL